MILEFKWVFFPIISLRTRVANNSISLIDNILTNIEKYTIQSGNIMSGISDHLPQFVLFDTDSKKPAKTETYYRDYRSMDTRGCFCQRIQKYRLGSTA